MNQLSMLNWFGEGLEQGLLLPDNMASPRTRLVQVATAVRFAPRYQFPSSHSSAPMRSRGGAPRPAESGNIGFGVGVRKLRSSAAKSPKCRPCQLTRPDILVAPGEI